MFIVLVRARVRMIWNSVRSAPRWQQGVIAALGVFAVGLFFVIAASCAGLVLLGQGGRPAMSGLSPLALGLVSRAEEYLFFFLLAGSIPFVAATLFQADDLPLLLSTPVSVRALVGAKLLDAAVVNAGQFVFLGVPVLVGLGWATGQGPAGWAWLLLATVLLLALPPAATALLLLAAARVLGLRRVRVVVMLVSVALGLAVTSLAVVGASRAVQSGSLDLSRLQAALHPPVDGLPATSLTAVRSEQMDSGPRWLPSAWAASALVDTAGGHQLGATGMRGMLALGGTTVVLVALCILLGQYVMTSESVLEQDTGRRSGRRSGPIRLFGLSPPSSGLLLKDRRYLQRDLILLGQIGTALILFLVPFLLRASQGIGAGMDNDLYGDLSIAMVGLVVYMVTSIVGLSSVGLEGRSFWMILTSPITLGRFLRAKWTAAFLVSTVIVVALTAVASLAFHLSGTLAWGSLAAYVAACLALSGLGVGLGGLFPRFVYENPAHRASVWALVLGFVLATGYVLLCGLIAGAAYLAITQEGTRPQTAYIAAALSFLVLSVLTGLIPVQMAEQRMLKYEWEF